MPLSAPDKEHCPMSRITLGLRNWIASVFYAWIFEARPSGWQYLPCSDGLYMVRIINGKPETRQATEDEIADYCKRKAW